MTHLAEALELETQRADGLERALQAILPGLDQAALLSAASALRALTAATPAEQESVDYAAEVLEEAVSRATLGCLFSRYNGGRRP